MLADIGLPVPWGRRAATVDEAVAAARTLGFPVALKALGIAHKSEHGAVRLNLRDDAAVRETAAALVGLGSGLYVERMISGGIAELIVGITRDPIFGPVMTIGSGGVLVELLKDSATVLLPASREEIETALRGLKLFPLLDGYRGRARADIAATIAAIAGIADFAVAHAQAIEELDVNPLIVCGDGAWIADALLVAPSPSRGGSIGEADRGGVASAARGALAVPSEATPSGRFAATSPSRGEGISAGDIP
jgi:succinyl-CoA synthetase beta subunit